MHTIHDKKLSRSETIVTLSNDELMAVSGGGDAEDLVQIAGGLASIAGGAALLAATAPAAPAILAVAATTATFAFVAKAFETD